MDDDRIVLDRRSFEALAVGSRVRVLKALKERRKTLTELSCELELSASATKEHLDVLESTDLIRRIDDGHKWKYYQLTRKGKEIVTPKELRVWVLLSISLFALVASTLLLAGTYGMQKTDGAELMLESPPSEQNGLPMALAYDAEDSVKSGGSAGEDDAVALSENLLSGESRSKEDPYRPEPPPYHDPAILIIVAGISAITSIFSLAILVRNRLSPS